MLRLCQGPWQKNDKAISITKEAVADNALLITLAFVAFWSTKVAMAMHKILIGKMMRLLPGSYT